MAEAVIISAGLDSDKLTKAIDKLVKEVDDKMRGAAEKFENNIGRMQTALDNFANIAKSKTVDIKASFSALGTSFKVLADAIDKAAKAAAGSGGSVSSGASSGAEENTIKWLKEQINLQKKKIDEQKLYTEELQKQVNILAQQKALLKQQTTPTRVLNQQTELARFRAASRMSTDSISDAEKKLRRLEGLLQRVRSQRIFNEEQILRVKNAIQKTSEQLDKLRAKASIPTTVQGVLGMSANNLNEIQAKMKAIANLRATLPRGSADIATLNAEYAKLSKWQSEIMGKNAKLAESNNALGKAFNYIKNRLAFALSIGAITNFTRQLYEIRGQYELLERSLGVLVNSFQRGTQIFTQLNQMAIQSPFTLIELGTAAKQLTAYNFTANEVVDTTRRMADISAALGVPMERLVYNLGQIRAQTVLTARDARDFANAGLPIVSSLAEMYTKLEGRVVSTGDVYDRMKKKAVSYNDVMKVLYSLTDEGGKFFDFQAKQAGTLKVQLANLNLAWNNMLNDIGKSNQSTLSWPIKALRNLFMSWKTIGNTMSDVVIAFGLMKTAQFVLAKAVFNTNTALAAQATIGVRLTAVIQGIWAATMKLFSNPWTWAFVGIAAITELVLGFIRYREEAVKFANAVATSAEESVDSIEKFRDVNEESIRSLRKGKLSADETQKLWVAIKDEIENSSAASSAFLATLMKTTDVSERLKIALGFVDSIEAARIALQELNVVKVNEDVLWGIGGEGLVSDLKDYNDALVRHEELIDSIADGTPKLENLWESYFNSLERNTENANKEIEEFANEAADEIKRVLGKEGIQDGVRVSEAIAAIKQELINAHPEIQGAAKVLFDIKFDELMAENFDGVYDKTTTLWGMVMDQLRKDSGSLFTDITDDWIDKAEGVTDEQIQAFKNAFDEVDRNTQFQFSSTLNSLKDMINSTDFRIRVGVTFGFEQLTELQKDFNQRFLGRQSGNAPMGYSREGQEQWLKENQIYIRLNAKEGETTVQWAKRLNDEYNDQLTIINQATKSLKSKSKAARDNAAIEKADAEATIAALKEVAEWEGFSLEAAGKNKPKKTKTKKTTTKTEDLVAKALQNEISLINEMRNNYDKLRRAGVDTNTALAESSTGYERTIAKINSILGKYGIAEFKITDFVGKDADVNTLFTNLKNQLDTFVKSGKVKLESLKALEQEVAKIRIEADVYNLDKITKGLNNELDKLKEEYELGVELDANPELGDIFADMMGISKDQLKDLPRDFQGVLNKMQSAIDSTLGNGKFSLSSNLNKEEFDTWIKAQGNTLEDGYAEALNKMREYANKVRLDEAKKIISDWDKLLEKYSEYEYKRVKIVEETQREIETARKKGASADIIDAIVNRGKQDLAKLNFDEFQKSSIWITATGDLSRLSNQALQLLIDNLVKFKRVNKDLEPKQIQKINKALRQLRKEQAKDNPFKVLSIAMLEAEERAEEIQMQMDEVQAKIDKLEAQEQDALVINPENQKILKELYELLRALGLLKEEVSKIPFMDKEKAVSAYIKVFKAAADSFKQIADSTNDFNLKQSADMISDVIGNFEAAEQGAETWGGWWGAVIGGVTDAIPKIFKWLSGNDKIDYDIQQSQIAVKNLENTYKKLEHEAEKFYGTEAYGAKKSLMLSKQLQIQQLEYQLQRERDRKEKYKDQAAINDLESQIIDLKNEIADSADEIANDLLGISSKGDFAEQLVKDMISAFKEGEDYMKVFEESFDDMVDNMIMKAIVSRLVGSWINSIFDQVEKRAASSERAKSAEAELSEAERKLHDFDELVSKSPTDSNIYLRDYWKEKYENALAAYNEAITPTPEDISGIRQMFEEGREDFKNNFLAYMDMFGIEFGQNAGKADLSALQQGIQGITEDTAGALEAYMNSVSQQVYLHSDLLTQIRDILINFGGDVTIATNAQILLQLQQSFQVQMTIQNTLTGVLNASGLAFRVELTN